MAKLKDNGWYEPKKDESATVGMTTTNKVPQDMVKKTAKRKVSKK